MAFVLDASLTMAWCFEDEADPRTDAVLDHLQDEPAVVPMLWRLEVANVLLVAQRRKRLTPAQSTRFVELLEALPISVDESPVDLAGVLATALGHQLSAYDATYLLLASRLGLALATADHALAQACRAAGVALLVDA